MHLEPVMPGYEEAMEMRKQAEYKEKARKALDGGLSSYKDLNILIKRISKQQMEGKGSHGNRKDWQ